MIKILFTFHTRYPLTLNIAKGWLTGKEPPVIIIISFHPQLLVNDFVRFQLKNKLSSSTSPEGTSASGERIATSNSGGCTHPLIEVSRRGNHCADGRLYGMGSIKDCSFASWNPRRDKILCPCYTYAAKCFPPESFHRIDPENPVISEMVEMIGNKYHFLVMVNNPVKIVQDEKSWEP